MATKNIIPVSVESRFIAVADHKQITAGNVGIDFLAVTLDAEWGGLKTYVTFAGCAQDPTTLDYAAELGVPWEQIEEAGDLFLGIQGFDPSADVRVDTEGQLVTNGAVPVLNAMAMTVPIKVRDSGAASGVAPTEPTPGTLQRVEQDLLALEKLTDGAGETIANAETAASNANAAAESANASKEAAQQAASDASSAAKAATAAAAKADTAAGNADKATAAASSAADAANAATSDAITAEEQRKQTFLEQLEDWQSQIDSTAIASLLSSVSFAINEDGDLEAYVPVSAPYAFRLTENGDLEVVGIG